jgi:hypothetical protein
VGDDVFYNGKVNALPTGFTLNKSIAPNSEVKTSTIFDWFDTSNDSEDNKAQNDSMNLNLRFDLTQKSK